MKKTLMLSLLFIFSVSMLNAQGFIKKKKDEANLIKEKTLLVVLKDSNKELKQLYNDYIKKAIESEWTFNESIEFVSVDEYKAIKKDKSKRKNYAYLIHGTKGIMHDLEFPDEGFNIGLVNELQSNTLLPMSFNKNTSLGDVYFAIKRLQEIVYGFSMFEKTKIKDIKNMYNKQYETLQDLKSKTLLLDKDLVSDELKSKISSIYEYEYKLVDKSEIDNAIVDKTENICYIRNWNVFRADKNELMGSLVTPNDRGLNSLSNKLQLKQFKALLKYLK